MSLVLGIIFASIAWLIILTAPRFNRWYDELDD